MSAPHTVAIADSIPRGTVPLGRVENVVLVCEAVDAKGGASIAALQSAAALSRAGLRVHIFAATGPLVPPVVGMARITTTILDGATDVTREPRLLRATRSLWNSEAARRLAEILTTLDSHRTIVHCHSFQVQLTSSVLRTASQLGFRIIVTSHDYGLGCPYSGFYNYNLARGCGHKGLGLGCATTLCNESKSIPGKTWHLAKAAVQRKITSSVKHYAFVSEFSRRVLRPYLPPDAKTWVIPNILSIPKGAPRQLNPEAQFLFVGRLTHEKGPLTFARAAALLDLPVRFVGTGPLNGEIARICPTSELCGWVPQAQVRGYLMQARALVFPSQCLEGQPLVVQEAQAVGLPVIASDVCAAAESVEHGLNGFRFRSGDVGDLANAMSTLADDEVARRQGRAAYDLFWADPPTERAHVETTLAMYEAAMVDRKP